MTKKEINAILNYNFGEFLKEKINDRDISLKDLSAMIGIDYTMTLYKCHIYSFSPISLRNNETSVKVQWLSIKETIN